MNLFPFLVNFNSMKFGRGIRIFYIYGGFILLSFFGPGVNLVVVNRVYAQFLSLMDF